MRFKKAASGLAVMVLVVVGCDASGDSSEFDGNSDGSDNGSAGQNGGGINDGGGASGGGTDEPPPPAKGNVTGVVWAPQTTIPISGALVYLTMSQPPPIPDGVFCDACEQLTASIPHTLSAANGTFNLPTHLTGELYLVVQKGQFRRVRKVTINEGSQAVPASMTTLPARMDKANGDDIPKMALVTGQWDSIELSLAKLGLAELTGDAFAPVNKATASFDFIDGGARNGFLSNWDQIKNYHVVFIPCSGSSGTTCNDSLPGNAQAQETLRQFVRAGGKLYVTDYSYEFLRQPWPGLVNFGSANGSLGSGCLSSVYHAPATVNDDGLRAWLAAQNPPVINFDVLDNWTRVDALNSGQVLDLDGNPINATPKAWVSGNINGTQHPSTISFQDQCGRVMFSTYHTEPDSGGAALIPQELALLYVLLEVGVCVTEPDPD